ncbi:MAG TPA: DUF535 family protein [Rhodocyclaceae bacterium]
MYPEQGFRAWRNRVKLKLRVLRHSRHTLAWWRFLDASPLHPLAADHTNLFHLIHRPYLNWRWSVAQRHRVIRSHYRWVRRMPWLLRSHFEPRVLVQTALPPGARIVLHKDRIFMREGELVLSIYSAAERLLSLAFTLHGGARPRLYIGALQGNRSETARLAIKSLTRALHGLRPRDLLVFALQELAQRLDVKEMLAVADCSHFSSSPSYKFGGGKSRALSYDDVWREHQGRPARDGFFSLPLSYRRKPAELVPSHKRAQYRRRYAQMDAIAAELAELLARSL